MTERRLALCESHLVTALCHKRSQSEKKLPLESNQKEEEREKDQRCSPVKQQTKTEDKRKRVSGEVEREEANPKLHSRAHGSITSTTKGKMRPLSTYIEKHKIKWKKISTKQKENRKESQRNLKGKPGTSSALD